MAIKLRVNSSARGRSASLPEDPMAQRQVRTDDAHEARVQAAILAWEHGLFQSQCAAVDHFNVRNCPCPFFMWLLTSFLGAPLHGQ